ncbi:hypothetical protein [Thiorhodovibrio winogradskyi]|uniref:hypothetical protein n=1 Tax=Thiorhodovibrio winogradskyi TaxID=77007 RepID=UPI002E298CA4|nr:hypothetical protein [Thiorhodovibrio winogradskyi]
MKGSRPEACRALASAVGFTLDFAVVCVGNGREDEAAAEAGGDIGMAVMANIQLEGFNN